MRPAFVTPGAFRYQLPAQTRACYTLLAAFAEYELLAAPRLKQEHMVVIESYFMRTIAKELVKGVADPALLALASLLPPPQAIIWLDVPASVAYQRKRGSLGVFEYLKTPTLDDFAHFQSTVLRSALDLAETARIHKIDATRQPDIVYREVLKHLLPYGQQ